MTQRDQTNPPRPPLTRAQVFDAAITLADRDGVGALSMRKLARELGVEAMSLYHHVANKEAILDGIVDLVFGEIQIPVDHPDWRVAMRQRALSAREALLRHSWAVGLMDSRSAPGPKTLRHHDAVLGVLRQAGFSTALAAHAFSVLDSYIYGFVVQETALPFQNEEERSIIADQIMANLPADEYPYFAEIVREHAPQPGYTYRYEFEYGLDLILDGLDRAHEVERAAAR